MPDIQPVSNLRSHYDNKVYDMLCEAELQAANTTGRRSHEEVMAKARELLNDAAEWRYV